MKWHLLGFLAGLIIVSPYLSALEGYETDSIATSKGDLRITFIGHGTLMFEFDHQIIHVDPVSSYGDYAKMPKADLILITHEHRDHLDPDAIEKIRQKETRIIVSPSCAGRLEDAVVLKNGDATSVIGLEIRAVPAYNIVHERENGQPFHPKGEGNGYVITFGDKKIYVAGDTENIPEMKSLSNIHCAFLPMNLPYTMTPAMTADAARSFQPDILYPYHFGESNTAELERILKDDNHIEVRIRKMK